jgi:membrane protease YdiL (CAAX protease family)
MKIKKYNTYNFIILSILWVILLLVIWNFTHSKDWIINFYIYQWITLLVTIAIIWLCYVIKWKFGYLKIWSLNTNATSNRLLWINKTDKWLKVWLTFSIVITIITAYFVITNYNNAENINLLDIFLAFLISIPLAIINSFNEEIITRWAIVEWFSNIKNKNIAPIVSAIIFGIPHYFWIPWWIIWVIMAWFLWYFLAISIQDTKGIWWAFIIHLLQDLVIITILVLNILNK